MKYFITLAFLLMFAFNIRAQQAIDLKTKTAANAAERTAFLDAFRGKLYIEWKLQFEFVVRYLTVSGNYACFKGDVQRKDGKEMTFPEDFYDCCHGEALLEKKNGKWVVLAGVAFSSDVWYEGIAKNYPQVPVNVFPKDDYWLK